MQIQYHRQYSLRRILRSSFIRADVFACPIQPNIVCACVRWNKSYTEYARFSLRHYRLSPNFTLCVSIFVRSIDCRHIRCCRSFLCIPNISFLLNLSLCIQMGFCHTEHRQYECLGFAHGPFSVPLSLSLYLSFWHTSTSHPCAEFNGIAVYVWALSPVLFLVVICLSFADESSNDILTCATQP